MRRQEVEENDKVYTFLGVAVSAFDPALTLPRERKPRYGVGSMRAVVVFDLATLRLTLVH